MSKNKTILVAVVAVASFITAFLLLSTLGPPVVLRSGIRPVMGTFARVTAVADDTNAANSCIEAAFRQFETVEELMNYHNGNSELCRINRDAYAGPVKVSQATFDVIEKAVEFSGLTNGAFEITVAPLVDLWRSAEDVNSVPSDAERAFAHSKIGSDKLILDPVKKTVRFEIEGMKIDLGGIAKGYAIDRAVDAMKKSGAIGGMVDIGGDIRVFGTPPEKKQYWSIGLQDPKDAKNKPVGGSYLLVLNLQNAAVATSGDYRRFALIQGEKYSHIIDARTGQTSKKLSSVTIITENAVKADALATAVSVLGDKEGLALIEKSTQTEVILISPSPEYKLIKTTGADKFIK